MNSSLNEQAAVVEAVLLLEPEPADVPLISRITGLKRDEVNRALETLKSRYSRDEHGMELSLIAGGWTFSPKERFWDVLKDRYGKQRDERLSRPALETLSIIAYSQPLTRSEIENIRGVGADSVIRMLKDRNLIREVGRKDSPGRPVLYGTTREFLKVFRLNSIAELPKLDEIDEQRFASDESD